MPDDRDRINTDVRDALTQLDGTTAAAMSLLTGIPRDELERYGGVPRADEQED